MSSVIFSAVFAVFLLLQGPSSTFAFTHLLQKPVPIPVPVHVPVPVPVHVPVPVGVPVPVFGHKPGFLGPPHGGWAAGGFGPGFNHFGAGYAGGYGYGGGYLRR